MPLSPAPLASESAPPPVLTPSILALRAGLTVLRAVQSSVPGQAGAALRRAARLDLEDAERAVEAEINAYRERLRTSPDTVEVVDYGAGSDRPPVRAVADIYRGAATGPAWGRFLFGLARGLRPRRVLELGTNLGVGAAHLAGALTLNEAEGAGGRLVTLEGAPALAERARQGLASLGHTLGLDGRVEVVVGPFAETLPGVLEAGPFDLVFVDGHHRADAALDYLEVLEPALAGGAVIVLDDVEPGRDVRRAWRALREDGRAATGIYVVKYGIFVHRPPRQGAATPSARESLSDPIRA